MRYACRFAFACAALAAIAATPAQATEARLAVVPLAGKGFSIRDLNTKMVEQNLEGVTILPYPAVARSAQKLGFKPAALKKPGKAAAAAKAAGATHVLLVESLHIQKHKRTGFAVRVSLVEVSNAKVTYSHTYALKGKRLDAAVVTLMSGDLSDKFSSEEIPPEDQDGWRQQADDDASGKFADGDSKPMSVATATEIDEASGTQGNSDEEGEASSVSAEIRSDGAETAAARPALRLSAGLLPYVRGAALTAGGKAGPCFCVVPASNTAVLLRGDARGEFYAGALVGHGAWWEGIGVHASVSMGVPRSSSGTTPVTATSNEVAGGLGYRLMLGDTATSPDLKFKLGYAAYAFNVSGLVFPSIGFRAPYGALGAAIPLGTEHLALLAEVRGMAPLSALVVDNRLGTQSGSGLGLHGEAGLRASFSAFDITALALIDNYTAQFSGQTQLLYTTTAYSNVLVTDRIIGGLITVGFHL